MAAITAQELPPNVSVVPSNPQTRSLMTVIRDRETQTAQYRFFSDRIVRLLTEHALSFLPVKDHTIVTPTGSTYNGSLFEGSICGVSIMRAGQCMEPALRDCCPGVSIGTFLIQRDEASDTKTPDQSIPFFHCLPEDIADRYVLVLDPMLATGGTVARAIRSLHEDHKVPYEHIIACHVISSLEGLSIIHDTFPNLCKIVTFEVDRELNSHKYIVPGLGDFGDRYFGTGHPATKESSPLARSSLSTPWK